MMKQMNKPRHLPIIFLRAKSARYTVKITSKIGSARDESNWRKILEYFDAAQQIGMTATPKREDNVDTYSYFGEPITTYSLRQGIDDGFLAPYRVQRVLLDVDAQGMQIDPGVLDRFGREVPPGLYGTKDFERLISLLSRNRRGVPSLAIKRIVPLRSPLVVFRKETVKLTSCPCAGCAWSIGGTKEGESKVQPSKGQELLDLKRAKDAGALTDAEYEAQKQHVLSK